MNKSIDSKEVQLSTPSRRGNFIDNVTDAARKTLLSAAMLAWLQTSPSYASSHQQIQKELMEVCSTNNQDESKTTLVMKAREYVPMQISYLKPENILPIVWQLERWDKKAYEHIEHLKIAEGTRIRDMMRKYWAWSHTPEEYKNLMARLNTGMTKETPKWYKNYDIVWWIWAEPSEHAHDERDMLNSIINKANFIVLGSWDPRWEPIHNLVNTNPNNIYIFWNSIYWESDKAWRLAQNSENFKKNLARSKNFLIFASWSNIVKNNWILKNKIYHENVNWNESGIYKLASASNWSENNDSYNHVMVTVWTNKNWDVDQSNWKTTGSKFPVWFHNQVLFAGRAFPYHDIEDWSVWAGSWSYTTSYPNYLNVAMTDLCFQMFAEVKDVDELLEMIRSTALKDYIRLDMNWDGDTEDVVRFNTDDGSYIEQPETVELQLINPAWYFREYCLPADTDLPSEIKTDETLPLNKWYYKWIIFNIPGAEVLINGERVAFDNENSTLIKSQNPFTLERRLNGELSKQLWCEDNIEWSIQAVDDERNWLKDLSKTFTVNINDIVSSIEEIKSEENSDKNIWYTVWGQKLSSQPTKSGVYIHNGNKVVIK